MKHTLETPISRQGKTIVFNITSRNLFAFSFIALLVVGLLASLSQLGIDIPLVRALVAVLFLTFIPGLFVLLQFDYHSRSFATTTCYVVGLSLFSVMVIGGITSLVYPIVGIENPFSLTWLLATWLTLTAIATRTSTNNLTLRFDVERLKSPKTLALLLIPLLSILGSVLYEVTGNNLVLLILLTAIAAIPILAVLLSDETWYFSLAVWCISLGLLYHGRLSEYYTFTQPLPQVTLEQLRWIPNYGDGLGSLLANGVLFPTYAIVSGLPMAIEWNLVNPILVSFLPVVLYEMFRRHVVARDALISACLFLFAYPFYVLYQGAGRAATPVIFIALLGFAYSDDSLPVSVRQWFLLAFGIGIATTHYGTAYVVMFALLVGAMAYATLELLTRSNKLDRLRRGFGSTIPDGGKNTVNNDSDLGVPAVLRPTFIAYYSAFALAWYLYTADSVKFAILPRKVLDAVQGVLYTQTTGSAVSAYQQNYAGITITISKYLHVVFGVLMATGIAATVLRFVVFREKKLELGFLAIAIGFFSMFIGSALPSGRAFSVARVMMIIFTFAVPFVVIGARELGMTAKATLRRCLGRTPFRWSGNFLSRTSLSLILAMFLLLNTGVVSETVTHDIAPSNQISHERLLNSEDPDLRLRVRACTRCDIQTHLWVGNYVPDGGTVYSGLIMENQLDYYAGTLASQTNGPLGYQTVISNQTDVPPGTYLALLEHNRDLGGFSVGYKFGFYKRNMNTFTSGSRLYSNGYGIIYYEYNQSLNEDK